MNDQKAESELKTLYQITGNAADINTILINRGEFRNLRARVAELEAQLESIGAGGVGPLMQPASSNHVEQHLGMVPVGWKWVPDEPTMSMQHAALIESRAHGPVSTGECNALPISYELGASAMIYRAMLAAAPQPPVVEQPQVEQEPVACRHRSFTWSPWEYVSLDDKQRFREGMGQPLYIRPQPRQPLSIDPAQQPPKDEPAPLEFRA